MQTLPVRTKITAPIILIFVVIVAGLYAIVWTVQWSTAGSGERIEQVAAAGLSSIQAKDMSNSLVGSLPAFSLHLDGAVAIESTRMDQWLDTKWMNVILDVDGNKWVWANTWLGCIYIRDDYSYEPVGTGEAPVIWNALVFRDQQTIKEECEQ